MGDFNAKIGSNNLGFEVIMGQQGLGKMNENGERFANLCAISNLVIGRGFFHHRHIHKANWVSPDLMTENQIDHVCIGKKFRRSLQDVRVRRGADVASDQHLMVVHIKLKLKRNWSGETNIRQVLQERIEEETIEEWQNFTEAVTSTCKEVLGIKKHSHKEWMTAEIMKNIEERKKKKEAMNNSRTCARKAKAHAEYSEANRTVRRSIRAAKKSYMEALAAEAKVAAHHGNMKDLYTNIKKLSGKFSQPERPVKDKEGKKIPDVEGQKCRWVEHFEELLNRPPPQNPVDIQPAENDLPIVCDVTSKEEIHKAIKQLRNGKSTGPDNIPPEVQKADVDTSVEMLYPLFRDIWKK